MTASLFCEHKKLRTGCALCKPASLHQGSELKATPFVPQEEREKVAERKERRATEAKERGEPAPTKAAGPRGPGKPLIPLRRPKKKGISAEEADAVKPWWVKG